MKRTGVKGSTTRRPIGLALAVCGVALTGCGAPSDAGPTARAAPAPASPVPDHVVRPDRLSPESFRPYSPSPPTRPSTGSHAPSAPTSVPSDCAEEGLRVTAGAVDGAMGLRSFEVRLVNCGSTSRTVNGYPDVRVLDERGQALDVAVHHGLAAVASSGVDDSVPRPVTLRPGQAAEAVVLWRNTYDDTSRPPLHGTHLNVAPAPGGTWQRLTPDGGVDLGSTGKLAVGPWRPAA
ncbi:DUF4232 domain-containing protein [Streptomyces sp. NPDC053079]|uniref:DUF4232 domain-containing protein n=1 Tax=Streptomyces sp. NPDC053079 TaxID=3365697 RepID=UPI0037D1ADE9